jgi:tetratricopeptide (TPR) repeat protein
MRQNGYEILGKRALTNPMSRDDFPLPVLRRLAQRAGHRCSNPDCRRDTSGPASTDDEAVNIGVAAHITAASAGGPRFIPHLTPAQRSAINNGIWLCQSCAKLIDNDEERFTTAVLATWKTSAELQAKLRLQTPPRPQDADEPILMVPSTESSVSLLPFSARATALVGRDAEREQLEHFVRSSQKVSWMLIVGAAGTGKSRLALELCHALRPEWNAGFLSRTDRFRQWAQLRPSRPTLIIIDYVASRAADTSALVLDLARSAAYLPAPVRILLLEREQGGWWARFLRDDSHSESTELLTYQHDEPLRLGSLSPKALQSLARDVAHLRQIPWTDATAQTFARRMWTLDPLGRPLFVMMVAAYLTNNDSALDPDLLSLVLKKEVARRRELVLDGESYLKMENLATLATLVGGFPPRSNGYGFLSGTDTAGLIANADLVDRSVYRDFVAATSTEATLAGFQPDILGERVVLDRLKIDSGVQGITQRLMLTAWGLEPDGLCEFILRAASDFPADPAIDILCDLPCQTEDARAKWGWLVGDLIRIANRSDDRRAQRLLLTLDTLARTCSSDRNLHNALARAELQLANIFLFTENNYEQAARWFDVAMGHAAPGTDIEAGIRNNRGILHVQMQNEDDAFKDWSDVIASEGVADEARACSLNNRADIFARRRLHEEAIRDRSAVLALKKTSPDRRYIALIRRSRSLSELGRVHDALRDVTDILGSADIAPEQKAEARLQRGVLYRELGRMQEANNDLKGVCSGDELFPGTFGRSVVELGELARRNGDFAEARQYLDVATSSEDADDQTLVEALIVWARVLADQGAVPDSERIWQSILANPHATARQRSFAENRDNTPIA